MTAFEVLDDRFFGLILPNTHVDTLWTGGRWLEGPVYHPAGRFLLFSDIPEDRVMRWDETDGSVSVFAQGCGRHNGHTMDAQGRILACEHGMRRVSRTEHDGTITALATHHAGQRLNSPNDLVVKSDGSIWFTDPTYGIDSDYEGDRAASEIGASRLYRIDPQGGVAAVGPTFRQPNGLAFNADELLLYVVDSGASHDPQGPRHIRTLHVGADGALRDEGEIFATCTNGIFDGLRVDERGNLWAGAGDGVHCLAPDGTLIGKIRLPETAANLVFGGPKRNRLFICATRTLFAVYLQVNGLPPVRRVG